MWAVRFVSLLVALCALLNTFEVSVRGSVKNGSSGSASLASTQPRGTPLPRRAKTTSTGTAQARLDGRDTEAKPPSDPQRDSSLLAEMEGARNMEKIRTERVATGRQFRPSHPSTKQLKNKKKKKKKSKEKTGAARPSAESRGKQLSHVSASGFTLAPPNPTRKHRSSHPLGTKSGQAALKSPQESNVTLPKHPMSVLHGASFKSRSTSIRRGTELGRRVVVKSNDKTTPALFPDMYSSTTSDPLISSSPVPSNVDVGAMQGLVAGRGFPTDRQNSRCKPELSSCVRDGVSLCGRVDPLACSCDVNCVVYRDCCENFAAECPDVHERALQLSANYSIAHVMCLPNNQAILCSCPVNSNPNDILYYCTSSAPLIEGIQAPVMANDTGLSFKSFEVAMCYGVDARALVEWRIVGHFTLSDDFDVNDPVSLSREMKRAKTRNGNVALSWRPPKDVLGRQCIHNSLRSCDLPDTRLDADCGSSTSYVKDPETSVVYANKHCLDCNGRPACSTVQASDVQTRSDQQASDTRSQSDQQASDTLSRSEQRGFSASVTFRKELASITTLKVERKVDALENDVKWKSFLCYMMFHRMETCSIESCIPHYELKDGACVPSLRKMSLFAYIAFMPEEVDRKPSTSGTREHSERNASTAADARLSDTANTPLAVVARIVREGLAPVMKTFFSDARAVSSNVSASAAPPWDLVYVESFWTRLHGNQSTVTMEKVVRPSLRFLEDSLRENGVHGTASFCLRFSMGQENPECKSTTFTFTSLKRQNGSSSAEFPTPVNSALLFALLLALTLGEA